MVCALGTHVSYIAATTHSEASPQLDHYLITSACKLTFRAATECTSWGGAVAGNADLRAVNELSTTAPSDSRGGIRSLPTAGLLRSHQARRRRERARRRHAREFITVSGSAGSRRGPETRFLVGCGICAHCIIRWTWTRQSVAHCFVCSSMLVVCSSYARCMLVEARRMRVECWSYARRSSSCARRMLVGACAPLLCLGCGCLGSAWFGFRCFDCLGAASLL